MPVVDGARVSRCPDTAGRARSLLRQILSSTQTKMFELKGAQAQHIGKIMCVAGREID